MLFRSNRINVLNKDLCRHLVLNSIRAIVHKFKRDYGNVIICCDSRTYWRKSVFPFYKADGTSDTISLISNSYLPFYNSSGTAKNIALI